MLYPTFVSVFHQDIETPRGLSKTLGFPTNVLVFEYPDDKRFLELTNQRLRCIMRCIAIVRYNQYVAILGFKATKEKKEKIEKGKFQSLN